MNRTRERQAKYNLINNFKKMLVDIAYLDNQSKKLQLHEAHGLFAYIIKDIKKGVYTPIRDYKSDLIQNLIKHDNIESQKALKNNTYKQYKIIDYTIYQDEKNGVAIGLIKYLGEKYYYIRDLDFTQGIQKPKNPSKNITLKYNNLKTGLKK